MSTTWWPDFVCIIQVHSRNKSPPNTHFCSETYVPVLNWQPCLFIQKHSTIFCFFYNSLNYAVIHMSPIYRPPIVELKFLQRTLTYRWICDIAYSTDYATIITPKKKKLTANIRKTNIKQARKKCFVGDTRLLANTHTRARNMPIFFHSLT